MVNDMVNAAVNGMVNDRAQGDEMCFLPVATQQILDVISVDNSKLN